MPTWHPKKQSARLLARAYYYRTEIFERAATPLRPIGYARRGALLPVKRQVHAKGCPRGHWYEVDGGGYVCTRRGFGVSSKVKPLTLHHHLPDVSAALPYQYAKVVKQGAPRYYRIPSPAEEKLVVAAASGKGRFPDVVEKAMNGVYLLAVSSRRRDHGRRFITTVFGRAVREDVIEPRPESPMHGEFLGGEVNLPLVFVYDEDRPLQRLDPNSGDLLQAGVAEKHARFVLDHMLEREGRRYVVGVGNVALLRDEVRIARRIRPPKGIPDKAKWMHVALSEQTLVAYEGDKPVFATLVSSGQKGYEPPRGLFRVHKKHVTTTMRGPDPIAGRYEVEEVPWSLFYWEGYAIHGTYWHDDFGKPRSHGCTNVSPSDGRWLFFWSDPKVPRGWHARFETGTHVYVSN